MSEAASASPIRRPDLSARRLRRRRAAERRFRLYGIAAIVVALAMLAVLLVSIVARGYTAFVQTVVVLDVLFDPQVIDPQGTRDPQTLRGASYETLVRDSLVRLFPEARGRGDRRALSALVSSGAALELQRMVEADPSLIGRALTLRLPASSDVDMLEKGYVPRATGEADRRLSDRQIAWVDALEAQGRIRTRFNATFFTAGDSREPELAGVRGAVVGTLITVFVAMVLALPLGVASAVYLEEFAPTNRWTDFIEVNINNLAAVPSIVFGLLGLAVFLGFFGLPRSAPLVGGMVLALVILPTIIIATRASLKAVPPSIREAAYGIGASKLQMVAHHVLPAAMPGILTGSIIGLAHAMGETAPLLMIGMVAFIAEAPHGLTDAATVLPVQIFLWADSPERGFVERTSAAVIVLLAVLVVMNAVAVALRRRFERRW
ncbi:MAG: phosphate ABC transporter permease PstA [Rhodospirillaceae bacterium]|nr:phosphate ABC transporter permease PstA [Rhodospirillaceae bacterium]